MKPEVEVVCFLLLTSILQVKSENGESRIIRDVMKNYVRDARPVYNDTDPVKVYFDLSINQIVDVNEKKEYFQTILSLRQYWSDVNFIWDPSSYGGVKSVHLSPKRIWLPDLVLYNNVENDKKFGGGLDQFISRVIISNRGQVTWLTPALLISKCSINIKNFPFDHQTCELQFGSWTHVVSKINLKNNRTIIGRESYTTNSEWELKDVTLRRELQDFKCCQEKFAVITVRIHIKRKPLYYLLNLIFPMVLINFLSTLTFFLPAESGERIGLSITLFLSMTVFMLIVDELMPETSDTVPYVNIFFTLAFCEMVVLLVITCYVLKMHSNHHVIPLWMRRVVYDNLSFKLGVRKSSAFDLNIKKNSINNCGFEADDNKSKNNLEKFSKDSDGPNKARDTSIKSEFNEVMLYKVDKILQMMEKNEEQEAVKEEWKICAYTIDRISLLAFLLLYTMTVLICFLIPSHG